MRKLYANKLKDKVLGMYSIPKHTHTHTHTKPENLNGPISNKLIESSI